MPAGGLRSLGRVGGLSRLGGLGRVGVPGRHDHRGEVRPSIVPDEPDHRPQPEDGEREPYAVHRGADTKEQLPVLRVGDRKPTAAVRVDLDGAGQHAKRPWLRIVV